MNTTKPWKAVQVVVNNAPNQWHVTTGEWGKPSLAVCDNEETARLFAAAQKLVEALEFYADSKNWKEQESGIGMYPGEAVDYGERAREALNQVKRNPS